MKKTDTPIRQVGVIRENQLFSNYRKTIFNIWFDGEQVIDTMSYDELEPDTGGAKQGKCPEARIPR